jgi:heme-degrading monooxygenase HmoA
MPTNAAVRVTLTMQVRAGNEAEFERAWRDAAVEIAKTHGNVRQALLRDPLNPGRFTVTSDWETGEAFSEFERGAVQHTLTARLRELRESAEMRVDLLVIHLEGASA